MLLELLSDFQISIPELGRIEARTHPVVLLTSNNSRELTEALKRRCLYLWLDYPTPERELEIVRLHAPELPETVARRLVEVDHDGPRARPQEAALDRRVDRLGARAAAARRATTSTRRPSATRCRSSSSTARTSTRSPSGSACGWRPELTLPRHLIGFARRAPHRGRGDRDVRAQRRVRRAGRGRAGRGPGRSRRRWRRRWRSRPTTAASSTSSSSATSSAPPRAPRCEAGVARGRRARQRGCRGRRRRGSTTTRCASRSSRRSAPATRPRCATSPGWRSPPSAAAARAPACSASTSSASAARSA